MPFVHCLFLWEDSLFLPLTLKVDMGYGGEKGELAMNMRTTPVLVYNDKIIIGQPKVYLLSYDILNIKESDRKSDIYDKMDKLLLNLTGRDEKKLNAMKNEEMDAIRILGSTWYVASAKNTEELYNLIHKKFTEINKKYKLNCKISECIQELQILKINKESRDKEKIEIQKWLKLHPMRTIQQVCRPDHSEDIS